MNLDIKLQEENTIFDAEFNDTGVLITDIIVDGQVSLTSQNPVQNKVITAYVNELYDKTKQQIDGVIDKTTITKYYSIDMDSVINNQVMGINVSVNRKSETEYVLKIIITLIAAIINNDEIYYLIDVPFEFINHKGLIWTNANAFKRIGLISNGLQQELGMNGIVWFDSLKQAIINSGFNNCEENHKCLCHYYDIAPIEITLTATTNSIDDATHMKELFDVLFTINGNKLVFEYSNQNNITIHEVECITENLPTTYSARGLTR